MDYNIFVKEWIKRSERKEGKDYIDIGDKFISLWIAFNAWLKSSFGEAKADFQLIDEVVKLEEMNNVFEKLKKDNNEFQQLLVYLQGYSVVDMRYPKDEDKKISYDGSFDLLIRSLYAIRCNLFHGRKNIDDDKKDRELVFLAYQILLPLFKEYLSDNEPNLL